MAKRGFLSMFVIAGASYAAGAAADVPTGPLAISFGPNAEQRSGATFAWRPISSGAQPALGSEVRCTSGCRWLLPRGGNAAADVGSIVIGLKPAQIRPGPAADFMRVDRIGLRTGTVAAMLGRAPNATLLIEGPGFDALVQKADARIVVTAEHAAINVIHGNVRVRRGAVWTSIPSGQGLIVQAGSEAPAKPLPPTPSWRVGGDNRSPIELSFGGAPAAVGGAWESIGPNMHYRVDVARDAAFTMPVETVVTAPKQTEFASTPLTPGAYFARVVTVSSEGLESAPSAPLALRVARASLPPGGVFDSARHTIILPSAEGARLVDTQGIEASLDFSAFGAPPSDLALGEKAARLVRLRLRDDPKAEASVRLERRALSADVEFLPHLPTWPRDTITVKVRVIDPSGRIDTHSIKPRIQTTIGLDEVDLRWTYTDGAWVAQVPPRASRTHEVVCVTAADDVGAPLARAFVEIAPSR